MTLFFRSFRHTVAAILVVSQVRHQGGSQAEPRSGHGGVRGIAYGLDHFHVFKGYLVAEWHAYLAVARVDLAMHLRFSRRMKASVVMSPIASMSICLRSIVSIIQDYTL